MRRPTTPNLLQHLARASWNRSAALAIATALLALAPAARAAEFEFKGQKIYYENAELRWIGEGTPEAIPFLIFREDGWFKSTQKAYGRALLVGGGGAGGYGTTSTGNPGAGGGGGGEV